MIGHCITCGKAYKKWGWFKHHYAKVHPDSKLFFRVLEIAEAHNREAQAFIDMPRMDWMRT